VKVCSLYGAGFYYVPGTDICLKLGGFVRYQVNTGEGQSISFGPFFTTSGQNTRNSNVDVNQRVRALLSIDTRQQTAYGTLRTYMIMGYTHDTNAFAIGPTTGLYFNRGFIQIAGFTFGKATSFFDFVSTAAVAYNAGFVSTSDTGDAGQIVGAYTAQLGNGVSATIGIEQSRRNPTYFSPTGFVPGTAAPGFDNLGGLGAAGTASLPDIVGNIRIDQAWGSAQLAAAAHDVSAAYYGGPTGTAVLGVASGHPSEKWGWAVSGGLRLNAPMISPGDYFQTAINYAQGAIRYTSFSGCAQAFCDSFSGNTVGFGSGEDATFSGTAAVPGSFNLTTSWSIFASYEHFWTPALRTSLYGSYINVSHNTNGNAQLCAGMLAGLGLGAGTACDSDFQVWNIGSRSQWNVTKDFYVGVDVMYQTLNSVSIANGASVIASPGGGSGIGVAGLYHTADQDAVSVAWRVHRDIVP
jgi:hypothetical protein